MYKLEQNKRICVISEDNTKYYTTVNDFVEYLKDTMKKKILSIHQWVIRPDTGDINDEFDDFILEFNAGTYCVCPRYFENEYRDEDVDSRWKIVLMEGEYFKEPMISTYLINILLEENNDKMLLNSDVVTDYRALLYGKRAKPKYWSMMSEEDFERVLEYEAKFLYDISSYSKARSFTNSDTWISKIPASVKTSRGVTLHRIVNKAWSINAWEMKNLPRGERSDEEMLIRAGNACCEESNLNIANLKRRDIMKTAPSLIYKFGSASKVRFFLLNNIDKIYR